MSIKTTKKIKTIKTKQKTNFIIKKDLQLLEMKHKRSTLRSETEKI